MNTKKVINWIKVKNIQDNSINFSALKGLSRINKTMKTFIALIVLGSFGGYIYTFLRDEIDYTLGEGRQKFLHYVKYLKFKENSFIEGHRQNLPEYFDVKKIELAEANSGILDLRRKLLSYAQGNVLETCKHIKFKKRLWNIYKWSLLPRHSQEYYCY